MDHSGVVPDGKRDAMNSKGPLSFRDDGLRNWLETQAALSCDTPASAGQQARIELGMWRAALDIAARRHILPLGWATTIADALGGPDSTPVLGPVIHRACHDAFAPDVLGRRNHYGDKHGADETALLAWASQLDPIDDLALRKRFSSWWMDPDSGPTVDSFAAHGIRCID
jgi:hypothetical protein